MSATNGLRTYVPAVFTSSSVMWITGPTITNLTGGNKPAAE